MKVSDWKIGLRLGLGFGLVAFLMIVVAAVGTTRMSTLNDGTAIIAKDRTPKILMVHEFIVSINRIARSSRNVLLMTDQAQVRKEIEVIEAERKKATELTEKLDRSLTSSKGRELFKAVADARMKNRTLTESFMKLALDGKKEEAFSLLITQMRPVQLQYLDALNKLMAYQVEMTERSSVDAESTYHAARLIMLSLTAAAILLAGMIAYYSTRSITRPLGEAVQIAQTVAKGDLTSRIEAKSKDETGQLIHALKEMNQNLHQVCTQVRTGTATMATATAQIAAGNQDLSSRTEQQASSLEETASSMEQLTSTVRQNGENAQQANRLAISASDIAVKGGTVVSEVVQTMGSINESSRKIVDIISVIDGIAFQTNILALNAAVEAARAGEQGRGFAVVASEVRNLAQRSASAAKEIKVLIDDSVEKVAAGSKLVDQAGSTMDEIVTSIRRVTDIMSEITAATREQVDGIEQINRAVTDMDVVTQQNAALVEEAAAAAESLQNQANTLVQVVSRFHTGEAMAAPALSMSKPAPLNKPVPKQLAEKAPSASPVRTAVAYAGAQGEEWEQF